MSARSKIEKELMVLTFQQGFFYNLYKEVFEKDSQQKTLKKIQKHFVGNIKKLEDRTIGKPSVL